MCMIMIDDDDDDVPVARVISQDTKCIKATWYVLFCEDSRMAQSPARQ